MTKKSKTDQNSAPSFLEQVARSRSKAHVERKKRLEESPYHPSDELLRQYVLAELDKADTEIVMEHVSLCGTCARRALKITWELKVTEPLIDRIKRFLSEPSFLFLVQRPVFARGAEPDLELSSYSPGTEIILTLEAPADGYVAIFHGCEATGEVRLVFPLLPEDDPKVRAGQQVGPIRGHVDGPQGKHFLKAFWTANLLLDHTGLDLQDEEEMETAKFSFFEKLEGLDTTDWQATTHEYSVVES
jgi:hypothetical protein